MPEEHTTINVVCRLDPESITALKMPAVVPCTLVCILMQMLPATSPAAGSTWPVDPLCVKAGRAAAALPLGLSSSTDPGAGMGARPDQGSSRRSSNKQNIHVQVLCQQSWLAYVPVHFDPRGQHV